MRARGIFKQDSHLVRSDRFELRHKVVAGFCHQTDRHLPQGANAIRIAPVVVTGYLATTRSIVNDFLLVTQVAKIRLHYGSEPGLFHPLRLRNSTCDCQHENQRYGSR
jgi:hypothetical protein